MALAAHSTAPLNWGRWPQNLPQDYTVMDNHAMMPYDSRAATTAPLQRPLMASQYVVSSPYTSAPIPAVATPAYQAHSSFYGSYHPSPPPLPPVLSSPFKPDYSKKPQAMYGGLEQGANHMSYRMNTFKTKPEPCEQTPWVKDGPVAESKTITVNETLDPAQQIEFQTGVDELMKVIQKTDAPQCGLPTPAQTPKATSATPDMSSPTSPATIVSTASKKTPKEKKYICNGPNCNKSFTQKTHLEIHRRTHSGERPYTCAYPNCGLTFSQRGNLKTHERRHQGEKPYKCDKCEKRFAQKGNVRSHEQTHRNVKPYVCRIGNCSKTFSQLGNMKTHQNHFHSKELQQITAMFVKYATAEVIPEEHRELFEYFKQHYKNSNKGIKGRGKHRNVAPTTKPASRTAAKTSPSGSISSPVPSPSPRTPPNTQSYNKYAPNPPMMMGGDPRAHESAYGTYGHDAQYQVNAPNGYYAQDPSRQVTFPDRMF
ncbi:hypothetical protein S40285_01544 [Stachybotrys chlorohalonatus IBT 40285]|uniref:C2H2-type domain-containing protein n=1 Tax=Stachybotrys chlorohalonatus (strain IBT 40285) TaxID=1283841 RepID=A0A084QWB1_STAC4|nr:hypothetical protein S40285_01544 [Stachybotrys chlorohalonata IBT 40285]